MPTIRPVTSRYKQIMKTFGQRLKRYREEAGWDSAQKFAHHLGLEPHAYRKYERGQSEPNYEVLTRICETLGITPNHLLPIAAQSRGKGGKSPHSAAA